MADMLFLNRGNGQIIKLEGDGLIHDFVEISRAGYEPIETVGEIYRRVSLIEHDPRVREIIMARLFLFPRCTRTFNWLFWKSDEDFEIAIKKFKVGFSYLLFPVDMEFERNLERGFGFGGALFSSLGHLQMDSFSYFQRQCFVGSKKLGAFD